MNKLIVLTDFGELSARAVRFGIKLAQNLQAKEVILLNIIVPLPPGDYYSSEGLITPEEFLADPFYLTMKKKHAEQLEKEAKKLKTPNVDIKPVVRFNDSKTDLNNYMEHYNASLLICGSRDEDSFLTKFFGSDTENLVRKMDYPMIILKEETVIREVKDIVAAIDVNENNQDGLGEIVDFASKLKARLLFLHVITDGEFSPEQAIEKMQKVAKKYKVKNYSINVIDNHSLEHGLRSFIRQNQPGMVALLSRGKGKLKNLIFGSDTEEVIRETEIPVFISKSE